MTMQKTIHGVKMMIEVFETVLKILVCPFWILVDAVEDDKDGKEEN